jgi:antirestriction protein
MTTTTDTPRVWIGCLAAYNEGHLHGKWVDADVEAEELWAAKDEVIRTSPAFHPEEWFLADHEGFGDYRVGEYESLDRVARVARMISEHGTAFAAWLGNDDSVLDGDPDEGDLEEDFREAFAGTWNSEQEFAEEQVGDIGLPYVGFVFLPKHEYGYENGHQSWSDTLDALSSVLDWDAVTRGIMEGCWTADAGGGQIHVFRDV